MTPALFWVLLVAGLIVSLPIGWRIGYRAGRRDHSDLVAEEWGEHVDQALAVFEDVASKVSAEGWDATARHVDRWAQRAAADRPSALTDAMRRHPSNVRYLRSRRDKIE